MDKAKTNKVIMAILLVVLFLIIVAYIHGRINHLVTVISGLIMIGAFALVSHYNSAIKANEERESEKVERAFKKIKVQRTREGTTFEVATALILAISLVIGVTTHRFELDDSFLRYYVCCFIGAIAFLILAYHPFLGFGPDRSSVRVTNAEMFKLMIRNSRVYAVLSALMALIFSINAFENHLVMAILICLLIAMFATDFLFRFLYKKNK